MPTSETHIKELLKDAIVELLQERRDELKEILAEIIEDIALTKAIEEGESTETVSKTDILQILEAPV